jgi:hypothetical protein
MPPLRDPDGEARIRDAIASIEAEKRARGQDQAEDDRALERAQREHAARRDERRAADALADDALVALRKLVQGDRPAHVGEPAGERGRASARRLRRGRAWELQPPRGGGTALRRTMAEGRGLESLQGSLRGTVAQIMLDAGEEGLTAYELPALIAEKAPPAIASRFGGGEHARLVKNAADVLYFIREVQDVLGVTVEKNGSRWRVKRIPHERGVIRKHIRPGRPPGGIL